jgi:hypothetical protein
MLHGYMSYVECNIGTILAHFKAYMLPNYYIFYIMYYFIIPCTILCDLTLQSSYCSLFRPWHSGNWIINFRSNRYMLVLGMLAYLKWIKWRVWLWMSRIMRYVWMWCLCHVHSQGQNGKWNIYCSVFSLAVSTVSLKLVHTVVLLFFFLIFLFHSIYLFILLSFISSSFPLSPACKTVLVRICQIIEDMNVVL